MSAWYFLVNDFESSIKISLWPRANTYGVLNMQTISDYYTRTSFVLDGWKIALSSISYRDTESGRNSFDFQPSKLKIL